MIQTQPYGMGIRQGARSQQMIQSQQAMRPAVSRAQQRQPQSHPSHPPMNRGITQQGVRPQGTSTQRNTQASRGMAMQRGANQHNTVQRGTNTQQNISMQRGTAQKQSAALPDINNLPDGVTYQPLDERTIAEIGHIAPNHPAVTAYRQNQQNQPPEQANQHPQSAQPTPHTIQSQPASPLALPQLHPLNQEGSLNKPSAPAFPGIAELPSPGANLIDKLEKLMQNERNGSVYYENLAAIAETSMQVEILRKISERCLERGHSYNELYKKHKKFDFETKENLVIGVQTLYQGISLALTEEEEATRELIKLYESTSDVETRHVLSVQLYKKISDVGALGRMVTR